MLRRLITPNSPLHEAYRHILMFYKRRRYGLEGVHSTFFMNGKGHIARDLIAHEYSTIGEGCYICPGVELGPYVMVSSQVAIVGREHRWDIPGTPMVFSGRPARKKTVIEADVWVGHGAILMSGIRVGRGSIVAAGAVVSRNVQPYEIVWGAPARKIFERFSNPRDRERHEQMLAEKPKRGKYPERML
jgi:acetyltransferase-like isoleucine patch superfamily enzyme